MNFDTDAVLTVILILIAGALVGMLLTLFIIYMLPTLSLGAIHGLLGAIHHAQG